LENSRLWLFLAVGPRDTRSGIDDVKFNVVLLFDGGASSTLKLLKLSTPERLRLRRVKRGISSPATSGSGKAIIGGIAYFSLLSRLSLSLRRLDILSIFVTMESGDSDEKFGGVNVLPYSLELPFCMLYQNVINLCKMEINESRRY
jgi:hypothetical protein